MIERRFTKDARAKRRGREIEGYAAVFYRKDDPGTEYELIPGFKERIGEHAFDGVLERGDDVLGLFNHDLDAILGRRRAHTLELSVDNTGLRYRIQAADTERARDLLEHIDRGDIDGSSFSFLVEDDGEVIFQEGDQVIRLIRSVDRLIDVGPVTFPAYEATSAAARSGATPELTKRLRAEAVRIRLRDLALERGRLLTRSPC